MTRYALYVEYIGTEYKGSQKQKSGTRTIQELIENSIRTLIKEQTKTVFQGRTDSGVHAKCQILHFDTEQKLIENKFLYSLNGLLPEDISVFKLEKKNKSFHAQLSAKYRHYRYVILNSTQRSAWNLASLYIRYDLNIERMKACLKLIEGEHDFSSFKSSSENPAKICTIYKASIKKKGDKIIIDIIGNRFLYNMIRTIVGTLLYIEKNDLAPSDFNKILDSKDRTKAGPTISPNGLTLFKVSYKKYSIKENS